jgi:hypothetical protein
MSANTPVDVLAGMSPEMKTIFEQLKAAALKDTEARLNAVAAQLCGAQQPATQPTTAGAPQPAIQPTTAGVPASVAPATRPTNSVWPLLGAASAAAVAPVIAPTAAVRTTAVRNMSSTAVTDVDPNAELYRGYLDSFKKMQVPEIKVAFATGIVTITFSLGYLPVDAEKMWKRMHGIRPNAKPTPKGFVYTVTMTVEAASRYGKTSTEIEAAFLAHLALAFSRRAKNGNTQTYSVTKEYMSYFAPNLELTDEEKKFCTTEDRMLNTYRFIQEYLAKRNGTTPRQPRTTTGGGGGGGGAAMPTEVNDTRSAKVNALPEEKTEEFEPTKELGRRIKNSVRPIVGGPLNDPAGHERLQKALKENNIAYSSTSGTFSSPNLTAAQIEEILCKVFSLQTTAEIAANKRKARAEAFKKQQAAESTQIGAIPDGAESDSDAESDAESDADTDAEPEDPESEAGGGSKEPQAPEPKMVDNIIMTYGPRANFGSIATVMIAAAADAEDTAEKVEEIVDALGAEYGVYINANGVYSITPDDVHTVERTREIEKKIRVAIMNLADQ